ncbi:MAG: helix-turn-helix domain-containing protein [Armatimonadetes bacterium]|nr:helix-turn-helix domain-containing protein [Armatimonadota bacterium]
MNLADAIRKAAQDGSLPTIGQVPTAFQPRLVEPENEHVQSAVTSVEPSATVAFGAAPELPHSSVFGGNVVRIELFMSNEQTSNLLRAIMTGQHTVLTVAEAAHYLRVRPQTLAKMADDGELPAVEIDGKWRFLKSTLDEWLATTIGHPEAGEEQQDVA